ncbi:penicillin-binding transpeptidase domain-containing protein [Oceanobacillus sp. CAU 1775]
MKRLIILLFLLLFLAACSNDDHVSPNERFNEFVSHWNNEEFEEMYEMFATPMKENITVEDSVERYKKIYGDLSIENLNVSFEEFSDEEIEELFKNREDDEARLSITYPFTVEMESIGGPIVYEYEATLTEEPESSEEDAELNWYVEWNPGFIHPELADGGQISITSTTPTRGEILDRNQMPLALNDIIYEIGIVPGELGENAEQAKSQIANILNISVDSINNALSAGWVADNLFVPITTILPENEEVYRELMSIPGVQRKEISGRVYPGGEATAHLIGYIGNITAEFLEKTESDEYGPNDKVGIRGLEQQFEERLKGKKGMKISVKKDNDEEVLIAEKPVENGENIVLTIDINIQERIFNSFGEDAGNAAAIDPKTGETLALVSAPAFDPNEILYGTSGNVWAKYENNEQTPLINRFAAKFAPGSVIKPITAAVGMRHGTLDPNEGFTIEGYQWGKGESWGNYEVSRVSLSDGPVDLEDAIVRSDNIYFAMQAVEMQSDAFVDGFEEFGFAEELPYEYPITTSTISNDGELNDEVLLVNSSYGQGQLEMSGIHLASAYTTFLNDGNMIKPTLLANEETGQIWKENLISSEEARLIHEMLRAVVTDGTAGRAEREANVPVAGKTGTVELKLSADVDGSVNSTFVGYPYDSQDILIAILVEDTENKESGIAVGKFVEIVNYLHPSEDEETDSE